MSKYKNIKVEKDGYIFDSMKEAERYCELVLLLAAGEITDLTVKTKYVLIPKNKHFRAVTYEDDFSYTDKNGDRISEDVKPSFPSEKSRKRYQGTSAYRMFIIKKKLMYHVHGIEILEV